MGVTLAGSREPIADIILNYLREAGGTPESTAIGTSLITTCENAAFANGVFSHCLDFDDTIFIGDVGGHFTSPILSSALTLGERLGANGRDVLLAFIAGFGTACIHARAVGSEAYERGWHSTSASGIFGAVAAACKLLKLKKEEITNALGMAGSEMAGIRENFGTMTKPFHVGQAASKSIKIAFLARSGFTASKKIFEGEVGVCKALAGKVELAHLLRKIGKPFHLIKPGIQVKLYPSCAGTHSAIDATLYLVDENKIKPEDVNSVTVESLPLLRKVLIYRSPKSGFEGKFSLEFCVATAICSGRATLKEFTDEKAQDRRIIELEEKVNFVPNPEFEPTFKESGFAGAKVKVRTRNMNEYEKSVDIPRGNPMNPVSNEELKSKFKSCASLAISEDRIRKVLNLIERFEAIEVKELMGHLRINS